MSIFQSDFADVEPVGLLPVREFGRMLSSRRPLPSAHRRMVGPFVFLEQIGPKVFEAGQGFDMHPHPHLGLATVTYLVDGEIVHRDSLGGVQTIRPGEVNWMTAGSGIVHSERTPQEERLTGGAFLGIQAWVALPCRFEEIRPSFVHHAMSAVPRIYADGVELTVIAGQSDGLLSPVQTFSDMIFAEIVLTSGARYQVKPEHAERAIYVVGGEVEIVGQPGRFMEGELIVLQPGAEVIFKAPAFHSTRLMLMGGEPFAEPRYMYWNFVSSSVERIEQAKADWRERLFPSVAGEEDLMPMPGT
jgi:redox-sensitive bicupin YhaK (pirin superfamily)